MAIVTFGAEYLVHAAKDEIFVAEAYRIIGALAGMPGHLKTRLYRDASPDHPHSYLIYSEWENKEAFEAFIRSDAFAAAKSWGREGILRGAPRHHIFITRN